MCTVCLWKEANCLHVLLAKHCSKPHHFPSKKLFLLQFTFFPTDGVCWYFLSHLRGGKCGRKKEKWFAYGVTWAHKKTQFGFAMVNRYNGRKVYCLLQATVNIFCLCVGTQENVWLLKTAWSMMKCLFNMTTIIFSSRLWGPNNNAASPLGTFWCFDWFWLEPKLLTILDDIEQKVWRRPITK